jgi:SAM-dependent methyltransferase
MARIAFVPYPPTSFPYRDLLVLEQLALRPDHHVCEIGVGSGGTTVRLARMVADVTGFEISTPTVEALRYLEKRQPNLHLVSADVTDDEALASYAGRFDRVLSCDTLEHVPDPTGYFRGVALLLAPGGEFLITFPNEPADIMHGITRFDTPLELHQHIADAGLVDVRMGAARLTPHAERVADALGWRPLSLARGVIRRSRALMQRARGEADAGDHAPVDENGHGAISSSAPPPQTFEETRFFRYMRLWRQLSPAVNLYWYGVLRLMASRGPTFHIDWDFCETPFSECQIFITGRKPAAAAAGATGPGEATA